MRFVDGEGLIRGGFGSGAGGWYGGALPGRGAISLGMILGVDSIRSTIGVVAG